MYETWRYEFPQLSVHRRVQSAWCSGIFNCKERPTVSIGQHSLGEPQSRCGRADEEKNLCLCHESNCSLPDRIRITSPESFLLVLTASKMEIPSSGFHKCAIAASFLSRGTGRNNRHNWQHNYSASHRENGIFNSTPSETESVQSTVEVPPDALLQDICILRDLTARRFYYFFTTEKH